MTRRLLTYLFGVCYALLFCAAFQTQVFSSAYTSAHNPDPPIRHVFVITLENKNYSDTFGPDSDAPFLARTLRAKGALLTQYYGTGHASLDNYIAMISGQSSTPQTAADCGNYEDFHQTGTAPDGQVVGYGCVYPASLKTLANQLMAAGLTWKGYMEDMGNNPARKSSTCGHPPLNGLNLTQEAEARSPAVRLPDMYAVRHDPSYSFTRSLTSLSANKMWSVFAN